MINNNKVSFWVQGKEYNCNEDYELVAIQFRKSNNALFKSAVRCPNMKDFISKAREQSCPSNCHYNGICQGKKCDCFFGYNEESDCKNLLPNQKVKDITTFQSHVELGTH